ncbi:MAG TPA: hypothetical protein VFN22_00205 [Gemmatimonadales bacterium]|nr:hypothetical protein [Gemmatimonadales bacterium]
MTRVPARIDRATFERVLQRASELQAQRQDVGETLSEDEILALGREVGISESHLRQALVESRMQVEMLPPDGAIDRTIAPAELTVERVIQGSQDAIGAALTEWFEKEELLAVQRTTAGRIAWEQLTSFAGAMRKLRAAFDQKRGPTYLDRAQLVTAVITPLEDGYCHVTLIASLRKTRTGYLIGGSAVGFAGVTAGAVATILGAPELILAAAAVPSLGAGWLIARAYRPVAERARVGLLRALDQLERRPALPRSSATPLPKSRGLAVDIGGVVRDITREVRKAIEEGKQ